MSESERARSALPVVMCSLTADAQCGIPSERGRGGGGGGGDCGESERETCGCIWPLSQHTVVIATGWLL